MSFRDNDRKLVIPEMPTESEFDKQCIEVQRQVNEERRFWCDVLDANKVAAISVAVDRAMDGYIGVTVRSAIINLCRSHERLRAELGRLTALDAQKVQSKPLLESPTACLGSK